MSRQDDITPKKKQKKKKKGKKAAKKEKCEKGKEKKRKQQQYREVDETKAKYCLKYCSLRGSFYIQEVSAGVETVSCHHMKIMTRRLPKKKNNDKTSIAKEVNNFCQESMQQIYNI